MTWAELVRATGDTSGARRLLREREWFRVVHNAYVPRGTTVDLACRVAALRKVLPEDVAIAGRTALWVYGVAVPQQHLDLAVPRGRHLVDRRGIRIRSGLLQDEELCDVRGLLVVSAARAVVDIAREEALQEAVVVADLALRAGATTLDLVDGSLRRARGLRGVEQARVARGLFEPRSESPMETRLRLRLVAGGLTGLEVQCDLYSHEGHVARSDLYVDGVAVEFDGRDARLDPTVFVQERRRQTAIAELALELRRFTSADVYGRSPASLVAEIRRAQVLAADRPRLVLRGPDTLRRPRLRPWSTLAATVLRAA